MTHNIEASRRLTALLRVIIDECKVNPAFEARVNSALEAITSPRKKKLDVDEAAKRSPESALIAGPHQKSVRHAPSRRNRRAAALLDPIDVIALEGEPVLRNKLSILDIEKLRDIIAQFAMDPSRLVMKWRGRERVINHIVSVSLGRVRKGDAFR